MKFIIVMLSTLVFTACSTIDGVGKDISSTAQWTKEKMSKSK